jgi:hypothetical protein
MKRIVTMLLIISGLVFSQVKAADTKVEGRIYGTWWMYMNDSTFANGETGVDAKGFNQFSLDRSYMSLKSKLTDYTSVTITSDLRTISGYNGYTMILKYGYANIKMPFKTPLSLSLGLQPTRFLDYNDSQIWGRRYIEKSIGDRVGFWTTSDLGATIDYAFGPSGTQGSVGLSIWNGTSYSNLIENNKNKDFNFYAAYKPLINNPNFDRTILVGSIYMGTQNIVIDTSMDAGDYNRQIISFAGKVNYGAYIDLGGEYWANTLGEGPGADDLKQTAISFHTALYAKPFVSETSPLRTLNLLFRYDMLDPNTDSDAGKNNQNLMILGLECAPIKGISASLNYRSYGYENSDLDSQNYLYFNSEFRF